MYILILTVLLCLNQFGHSVKLGIVGGPYQQHRYMNTHVILAVHNGKIGKPSDIILIFNTSELTVKYIYWIFMAAYN
jgi:hypothetical protein